jgi:hypothetical protein
VYNAIQNFKTWSAGKKSKEPEKVDYSHGYDDHEEEDGGFLDLLSLLSVGGMLGFLMWTVQGRWRASRSAKGSKGY